MENKKGDVLYLVYRSKDWDMEGWPIDDDFLVFITKDPSEAILSANNEWDLRSHDMEEHPDRYEMVTDKRGIGIGMEYELAWQLGSRHKDSDWTMYVSIIKVTLPEPLTDDVKE